MIPIGPACAACIRRSSLIARNVPDYNRILRVHSGCDPETLYLADHHHLSVEAHRHVAEQIVLALSSPATPP